MNFTSAFAALSLGLFAIVSPAQFLAIAAAAGPEGKLSSSSVVPLVEKLTVPLNTAGAQLTAISPATWAPPIRSSRNSFSV
ncbi:hypothetical protein C8R45DRAFT_1097710 [Mycena sanguinolenta]|nr:hypothetical protein C8R45DRAFT_1097710 [Mycena sanguinolenta]